MDEDEHKTKRPTWDEYYKKIVIATKERSPCERCRLDVCWFKITELLARVTMGFYQVVLIIQLLEIIMNKLLYTQNKTAWPIALSAP